MGNRLSQIVTKTGDAGTTGLTDGSRHPKNDTRIECLGEVDELNATIGLILSALEQSNIADLLIRVQHDLFDLGAELSQPDKSLITDDYVKYLEQQAAELNDSLPPLKEFILPGGSTLLGFIHLARTVCRRVERHCVELHHQQSINPLSLKYLNRLSDLLFILARFMAKNTGHKEVYWQSQYSRLKMT